MSLLFLNEIERPTSLYFDDQNIELLLYLLDLIDIDWT